MNKTLSLLYYESGNKDYINNGDDGVKKINLYE